MRQTPALAAGGRRLRLVLGVDSAVYGGAEAYVASLLEELADHYACTVLATEPVPPRLAAAARAHGELVVVRPVTGKRDVTGLWALRSALRATRPDLVHVNQSAPTNNRHLMGVALLSGVPVVPVLHLWGELPSRPQRRMLTLAYRRAARVVVVSEELRGQLLSEVGLPLERVRVVRNGVRPLPRAEGTERARLRIGSLGRLVPQKGFDVLVEACRLLAQRGTDVEVVVAGEGPRRAALEAAAAGLPVTFPGSTDRPGDFLAGLDAFCLPSRAEGLPLALLEAMTTGLPCVATAVGGMGAALTDVGLLVPPDDPPALAEALARLAGDPALRARLGTAARERALSAYSSASMAAATSEVYERAVRGRG